MLLCVLIGLSLVLLGISGLQFFYMFYVDRLYRERERHVKAVEARYSELQSAFESARERLAEQSTLLSRFGVETDPEDEFWAEVIHER